MGTTSAIIGNYPPRLLLVLLLFIAFAIIEIVLRVSVYRVRSVVRRLPGVPVVRVRPRFNRSVVRAIVVVLCTKT